MYVGRVPGGLAVLGAFCTVQTSAGGVQFGSAWGSSGLTPMSGRCACTNAQRSRHSAPRHVCSARTADVQSKASAALLALAAALAGLAAVISSSAFAPICAGDRHAAEAGQLGPGACTTPLAVRAYTQTWIVPLQV